MESMHLQAHLSIHNKRCCVWKKNEIFRRLKDVKDEVLSLYLGLGMTNECKNLGTTKYNSLSLLKALTFKITGCNPAVSPKSTTH